MSVEATPSERELMAAGLMAASARADTLSRQELELRTVLIDALGLQGSDAPTIDLARGLVLAATRAAGVAGPLEQADVRALLLAAHGTDQVADCDLATLELVVRVRRALEA